jgi:hypothetical protein
MTLVYILLYHLKPHKTQTSRFKLPIITVLRHGGLKKDQSRPLGFSTTPSILTLSICLQNREIDLSALKLQTYVADQT